jgi:outer membrane protein OmpA-like peptidoglycan-associated protein
MKNLIFSLVFMLTSINMLIAQDIEGCKDHPMFNRMANYFITECSANYGITDLVMNDGNSKTIEGYKTEVTYEFRSETGHQNSFFQLVKNYENSLAKYSVKRIYLASQYATLSCKSGSKTIWIGIEGPSDDPESYTLTIVEIEEMKQEIQASAILDALNTDGHIALYINFATGKSDIKPESQIIINQIAEMLSQNPTLKVSIEGHTDNVGNATSNQTLSVSRANSVVLSIIAKGIDKSRLTAKGWGQTKPIADNANEEGKALNRRVEIVKM